MIGEKIFKIEQGDKTFYVEETKAPFVEKRPPKMLDPVYVCTRTSHRTSLYGQIESCGWIERSRLTPFKNTKGDRDILAQLQAIEDNAVKHSIKPLTPNPNLAGGG